MTEPKLSCPAPAQVEGRVTMAHGGGGRMTQRLIRDIFLPAFGDEALEQAHDGAALRGPEALAYTTDGFVVRPMFFPGGDIGSLAVHGTVNDLAMCGAEPLYMSCAFILEEGLELESLKRVAKSMAAAAKASGIRVVTGDTKVVEKGKGDGIFIGASGIGKRVFPSPILPASVQEGDAVILSGDVGRHGAAVMASRENLGLETSLESDAASLWPQVRALLDAKVEVRCLRDLTRGGLATALNEVASSRGLGILVREDAAPVRPEAAAVCEVLGLDPLYLACEGRFIAFVPRPAADAAIAALKRVSGLEPTLLGRVVERHPGEVRLMTTLGVERVLDVLSGEQLPRIC